jgi:hypothetical protein
LIVSGKVAPETVKPAPATVAALMVTGDVPVEDRVSVWLEAAFTLTLPMARLAGLTLNVDTPAFSCRLNVVATLLALAVNVTACAVLTVETVAVKLADVVPPVTVTLAGTVTAELLLARLTVKPLLAAAVFRNTVQLSDPAPVIDPLVQLRRFNTGNPAPVRLITVEVPPDELLVSVSEPVAAPAVRGSNCTLRVAV